MKARHLLGINKQINKYTNNTIPDIQHVTEKRAWKTILINMVLYNKVF